MFAGPTKPKPFERKRANLTEIKQGKMPPLALMRQIALERHRGSERPMAAEVCFVPIAYCILPCRGAQNFNRAWRGALC